MNNLTWEQKFQACQFLGEVNLRMRAPGDWYVNSHYERAERGVLAGGCVRDARTPQEAVEQHWEWVTDSQYYIVTRVDSVRKAYRWAGWGWLEIRDEKAWREVLGW